MLSPLLPPLTNSLLVPTFPSPGKRVFGVLPPTPAPDLAKSSITSSILPLILLGSLNLLFGFLKHA
jgi:hypothetical protein